MVTVGREIQDGVFYDRLVHVLSLRREWLLSGGSSTSWNNPEGIQNFPRQFGRAVVALSCSGRVGHFYEPALVGQKVREDGPNLLQIRSFIDMVVGDDGALASAAALALKRWC